MADSKEERRRAERVHIHLQALVEGERGRYDGTISDVSQTGCFVLAAGRVRAGELVRVEVELPTGKRIFVWGEVVYYHDEIGFAVRFTGVDETEQRMIELLIDYARR